MSKPSTNPPPKTHRGRRQSAMTNKREAKKKQAQAIPVAVDFEATELEQTAIEGADEREADSIETLSGLEHAIGIEEWVDQQTGESAKGQSLPHLEAE